VHLLDPEFQAFRDQLANDRMITLEGVAAASIVEIILFICFAEHIIDTIVQASEIDGRTLLIALAGVVD